MAARRGSNLPRGRLPRRTAAWRRDDLVLQASDTVTELPESVVLVWLRQTSVCSIVLPCPRLLARRMPFLMLPCTRRTCVFTAAISVLLASGHGAIADA